LFAAVGEAISQTAAQWTVLQAKMGFSAVLHSWGELLKGHPHVHCLVPGGGVSVIDGKWVNMPPGFFLPEKRLRQIFRDTYLKLLKKKYERGELVLRGRLAKLQSPEEFARWIERLARIEWITYARPLSTRGSAPGGIERTVKYLARYANRIAIANSRLISCDGKEVAFYYKDYREQDRRDDGQARRKVKRLPIAEFIRRFLQHVLPNGARRIRHFGFLTNNQKNKVLPEIRRQLGVAADTSQQDSDSSQQEPEQNPFDGDADNESADRCPKCGQGKMYIDQQWPRPTIAELLAVPWQKLNGEQPLEREMVQREMVFQE